MNENPDKANELMTENIKAYLDILADEKEEKPVLTEKGTALLSFLQKNDNVRTWKAKDLAEAMGISSRGASGGLRKLVNDGFCEKLADNPSVYALTEKGKNYKIENSIDE